MTTSEIQDYINQAIRSNFDNFTEKSEEVTTSEGGDGRFLGKVAATMYSGLPVGRDIFVAIGLTAENAQIVRIGRSECLKPNTTDLDMILQKELGIENREG